MCSLKRVYKNGLRHFLGLFEGFVDGTHHVERLLGQVIALARDNHFETADGLGQCHVLAG